MSEPKVLKKSYVKQETERIRDLLLEEFLRTQGDSLKTNRQIRTFINSQFESKLRKPSFFDLGARKIRRMLERMLRAVMIEKDSDDSAQGIKVVAYPKIIFFWPLALASLLVGAFIQAGFEPQRMSYLWVVVFSFNFTVISFDLNRNKTFLAFVLFLVLVLLPFIEVGQNFLNAVGLLKIQASFMFYYGIASIFLVIFGFVFLQSRWNYYIIEPNYIIHHRGFMGDVYRYPAPHLRMSKEIPDAFEFLLLGSGILILSPSNESKPIILENIIGINRKEEKIKNLLSSIQVKIRDYKVFPDRTIDIRGKKATIIQKTKKKAEIFPQTIPEEIAKQEAIPEEISQEEAKLGPKLKWPEPLLTISTKEELLTLKPSVVDLLDQKFEQWVFTIEKIISGKHARELGETPWFELLLSEDAGRPGILERFFANSRFLLKSLQQMVGTQCILVIHAIDLFLDCIAFYIQTLFRMWQMSKTMAKASYRKLTHSEIEALLADLQKSRKLLSRMLHLNPNSSSTPQNPTFPLEIVLESRQHLFEMKQYLYMLTEKQMTNLLKDKLRDQIKDLVLNTTQFFAAMKDILLLSFFFKYSRLEIEQMYIEMVLYYHKTIELKAEALQTPLKQTLCLEDYERYFYETFPTKALSNQKLEACIQTTRTKLQRWIQTLLNPSQYLFPHRWSRYDLIREVSKTRQNQKIYSLIELEFECWLRKQVKQILRKKKEIWDYNERQYYFEENRELKQKLKRARRLSFQFISVDSI